MCINVVNKYKHQPTEYDVYIGRGSPLGNPYAHLNSKYQNAIKVDSREEAINKYREYLNSQINSKSPDVINALNSILLKALRGEPVYLVCFCKPCACHGDVLKDILINKLHKCT